MYLKQERWEEVQQLAQSLEADAGAPTEAVVFQARAHLARREYAAAQGLLRQATAVAPRALWPRVVLSHALLQEGRDPGAAEQALRDILALDPGNAEARGNLAVLLRRRHQDAADQAFTGTGSFPPAGVDVCGAAFVVGETPDLAVRDRPPAGDAAPEAGRRPEPGEGPSQT